VEDMIRQMKQTAESLGLPFGDRTMTYNSRLAQELGLWAEDQNKGDEFHMAAFKAYFSDGKNIASPSELITLAESVELDKDEASQVLKKRSYQRQVDQDWEYSRQNAIHAVPTFMMNRQKLVGAQNYEALTELVEGSGVTKVN
jgi:predicted DsbA family dithiol-disulfide isomerase